MYHSYEPSVISDVAPSVIRDPPDGPDPAPQLAAYHAQQHDRRTITVGSIDVTGEGRTAVFSAGIPAAGNIPLASNEDVSGTYQRPAPAGPPAGAAACVDPSTDKLGHTYVHFVNTEKVMNKSVILTTNTITPTYVASAISVTYIVKYRSSPTIAASPNSYSYSSVTLPLC